VIECKDIFNLLKRKDLGATFSRCVFALFVETTFEIGDTTHCEVGYYSGGCYLPEVNILPFSDLEVVLT